MLDQPRKPRLNLRRFVSERATVRPGAAPRHWVPATPVPTGPEPATGDVTPAVTSLAARDRLLKALKFGHELWILQARFTDIEVDGPLAHGYHGCLTGPELESLFGFYPDIQNLEGIEYELFDATAKGIADCFETWRTFLTVPALPWFPSFAAWPGPIAPPTPNVPTPLLTCLSMGVVDLGPINLRDAVLDRLRPPLRTHEVRSFCGHVAGEMSAHFMQWLSGTMVKNVLGQGPVPSYSPPTVPAGPVSAGTAAGPPGHLS